MYKNAPNSEQYKNERFVLKYLNADFVVYN